MFNFFGSSTTNTNNKSGNQSSTLNAGNPPAAAPVGYSPQAQVRAWAPAPPSPAMMADGRPVYQNWGMPVLTMSGGPTQPQMYQAPIKPTIPVAHGSPSKLSNSSTTAPSPITPIMSNQKFANVVPTTQAKPQLTQSGGSPTNRASRAAGLIRGLTFADANDFLPQGFFDERRRTITWDATVANTYRPVAYVAQRGAWLKASPRPVCKHPLAPKEPKVAKPAQAKAGANIKAVKKASKHVHKAAINKVKKAPAKKINYTRPAPRPELFSGPMHGPFTASYYKLVNVYVRVPGPFAAAGNNDDFIAQGLFDEKRRSNMWAHTVLESFTPRAYLAQKTAWLKASPRPALKHALAPKELKTKKPVAAKQPAAVAKKPVATITKKPAAKVTKTAALRAKTAPAKVNKKAFTFVRPAAKALPPGPMHGPFTASYYKLVNVYIRVPGPFATAGDNDDCIAQGFFDERRRTATWAHTVPNAYVPVKYQAQAGAWLKAMPIKRSASGTATKTQTVTKTITQTAKAPAAPVKTVAAPVKTVAAPAKAPAAPVKTVAAPVKAAPVKVQAMAKPAQKTVAPTTTKSVKPNRTSNSTAIIVYTAPKSFMNMAAAASAKAAEYWPAESMLPRGFVDVKPKNIRNKRLVGASRPNHVFPKQKILTAAEKRMANERANERQQIRLNANKKNTGAKYLKPKYVAVSRIPGPFSGDVKASLPIGFFDEDRLKHVSYWGGIAEERYTPIAYTPQMNASLRAFPRYVRPQWLRAPKEVKEKKVITRKFYVPKFIPRIHPECHNATHATFNASPRQFAFSKFATVETKERVAKNIISKNMNMNTRRMSHRFVYQPIRRN